MNESYPTIINGKWKLNLPEYRSEFHKTHPDWEQLHIDMMANAIKPGMTVVDIGSECGDYPALMAKWVGEDGNMILIEAVAKMWSSIRQIWEMNKLKPPLKTFVGFASDKVYKGNKDKVDYYNPKVVDGWPSVTKNEVTPEPGFQHLCENDAIPQRTLDNILEDTHVDVINMDTEGSEWNILQGAESVLKRDRPIVFAALHEAALERDYGHTIQDVKGFMASMGYRSMWLGTDHEAHYLWTYEFHPSKVIL